MESASLQVIAKRQKRAKNVIRYSSLIDLGACLVMLEMIVLIIYIEEVVERWAKI